MTKFKDLKQPDDQSMKIIRLIAPVEVPVELDPLELMDVFIKFCKKRLDM